jgi:hypothetical protein
MSIGNLRKFDDLVAGQWFVIPDERGVGFVAKVVEEKRPIIFLNSSARMESPQSIQSLYVPEQIDIHVDSSTASPSYSPRA